MKLSGIRNSLFIVGGLSRLRIPNNIMEIFQEKRIIDLKFIVFKKLLKNGTLYTSEIYTRATVTNSTCAKYNIDGVNYFGIIHMFVRITNCLCRKV